MCALALTGRGYCSDAVDQDVWLSPRIQVAGTSGG
jgi:hypothetical protein